MREIPTHTWPSLILGWLLQWNRDVRSRPRMLFDTKRSVPLPELKRRVARLIAKSPVRDTPSTANFLIKLDEHVASHLGGEPPEPLANALSEFYISLLDEAGLVAPEADFTRGGDAHIRSIERRRLEDLEAQLTQFPRVTEYFSIVWVLIAEEIVANRLPRSMRDAEDTDGVARFSVPLIDLLDDPASLIRKIHELFFDELLPANDPTLSSLFRRIRYRLRHNLLTVSQLSEEQLETNPARARWPDPHTMSTRVMIDTYLSDTPFAQLLETSMPFHLPDAVRFEHMHVLAGTGHGKTQTLQHLIVADLERPASEIPSMVILDSQGDMIDALKRLSLFDPDREGSLASRLLIVDPSDVDYAPSLNLFDIQSDRLERYDQRDREQVLAGIIEIYDYIFGGLLGAELTQKQAMVFRFLAQLMLSIKGSTIHTLRELLEDATPYMENVKSLPPTARGFFENHFFEKGYQATREQVLRRLYGVLQNPSFERMFAQPTNRLDLFDTLNEGGIVLVNTAKDFLKSEASSIFGRYIIALTLKAAFERATLRREERKKTFLWVDEASEYFDDNIDNLLIQARKFNLGLVMVVLPH